MNRPFIRNHQYNLIQKHVRLLRQAIGAADPKVARSVRETVQLGVLEAFPDLPAAEQGLLEPLWMPSTEDQLERHVRSLEAALEPFEPVTEQQLKKLFPKVKKLKTPDLAALDWRRVTYLGWTDGAADKLFLAYRLDGNLVGIEGRLTPLNKKGACFLCNRQEEIALFTAVTKTRPAHSSPDYYKAIGQYVCADSEACNRNITDVSMLERFVRDIIG